MVEKQRPVPEQKSLVLAKISKIERYGAYCKLIEFDDIEAFIPLKEVSTGWIKNIHEFLHTGRITVCRVIHTDLQKGTIDVSLKRVTPKDSKEKISEYNFEKRVSSLFTRAIKTTGMARQETHIKDTLMSEFGTYTNFHNNMLDNTTRFKNSAIPKELKQAYSSVIETNRKKKKYWVSYTVTIVDYDTENGISEIKNALAGIQKGGVEVSYLGAPKYLFTSTGSDYIEAEKNIKQAVSALKASIKNGDIEVKKNKTKNEKSSILEKI